MPTAPQASAIEVVDSVVLGRSGHPTPVRDYVPARPSDSRPFLWIHGGGFVSGGLDQRESDAVARSVAATGRRVRTVDYRLVPFAGFHGPLKLEPSENRYPAPLHDVLDVYRDYAQLAGEPYMGGASAGACLALSAERSLRLGGETVPGLILAYGTFHGRTLPLSRELASRMRLRDRALALLFGKDSLQRMHIAYAGSSEALDDHEIFPGGGDLTGVSPLLVMNADRDGIRASGDALIAELAAAGARVDEVVVENAPHGFLNEPRTAHYRRGIAEMLAWMDRQDTLSNSCLPQDLP